MRLPTSFLYVITVLIWGTSWYAMEYQLVIPFELAILYRFALATAMLVGYCLVTGRGSFSSVSTMCCSIGPPPI
jgi:hypothetical protein